MVIPQRITLLFVAVLLAGCGFKLRGMIDMPPWLNNIAIVVNEGDRHLIPLLKEGLQGYGIRILSNPNKAEYLLVIEKELNQQQITSISASTTPRQYQLLYTVQYSLIKTNGKPIITSNTVSVTRQLTVNNDRILGSDSESMVINSEMRRDAAMQIINRLSRK